MSRNDRRPQSISDSEDNIDLDGMNWDSADPTRSRKSHGHSTTTTTAGEVAPHGGPTSSSYSSANLLERPTRYSTDRNPPERHLTTWDLGRTQQPSTVVPEYPAYAQPTFASARTQSHSDIRPKPPYGQPALGYGAQQPQYISGNRGVTYTESDFEQEAQQPYNPGAVQPPAYAYPRSAYEAPQSYDSGGYQYPPTATAAEAGRPHIDTHSGSKKASATRKHRQDQRVQRELDQKEGRRPPRAACPPRAHRTKK